MNNIKVNQSNIEVENNVMAALNRIEKGAKYGDDMTSSSILCYDDAIKLLTLARDQLIIECGKK
jgi:hypothetical protein